MLSVGRRPRTDCTPPRPNERRNYFKLKAKRDAYLLAEATCPAFVEDRKLRTLFLRRNKLSPKSAAMNIFDFLELKLDLWGREMITQRINIDNMGVGTRGALENRHMQLLPSKDLGGRRVIVNNANRLGGYKDGDDMARCIDAMDPSTFCVSDLVTQPFLDTARMISGLRRSRR